MVLKRERGRKRARELLVHMAIAYPLAIITGVVAGVSVAGLIGISVIIALGTGISALIMLVVNGPR